MLGFEPEKIWDLYPFNHSLQYCCNLLFASTGIESKSFDASFDVKVTITSSNLLSPLVSMELLFAGKLDALPCEKLIII
jgi:hypothetical protein